MAILRAAPSSVDAYHRDNRCVSPPSMRIHARTSVKPTAVAPGAARAASPSRTSRMPFATVIATSAFEGAVWNSMTAVLSRAVYTPASATLTPGAWHAEYPEGRCPDHHLLYARDGRPSIAPARQRASFDA